MHSSRGKVLQWGERVSEWWEVWGHQRMDHQAKSQGLQVARSLLISLVVEILVSYVNIWHACN